MPKRLVRATDKGSESTDSLPLFLTDYPLLPFRKRCRFAESLQGGERARTKRGAAAGRETSGAGGAEWSEASGEMLSQERAWDGIRQRRILPPRGWLSGAIQRRRALHDPLFKIAFYILPPVIGRQLALHAEAYLPFIEEEFYQNLFRDEVQIICPLQAKLHNL